MSNLDHKISKLDIKSGDILVIEYLDPCELPREDALAFAKTIKDHFFDMGKDVTVLITIPTIKLSVIDEDSAEKHGWVRKHDNC